MSRLHPGVAAHVSGLAPALDGAEQDAVFVALDEDHRRLRASVRVDGGQDAEMGPVEEVADGLTGERSVECHTYLDPAGSAEESGVRPIPPIPFRRAWGQHGDDADNQRGA